MSTAIYIRVSSKKQEFRSQLPDLDRWDAAQEQSAVRYTDKLTGSTMARPGWHRLEADIRAGKVSTLVVWRLDRLGRTAAGVITLLDELRERKVNFVSIKDGFDLNTPGGRLMYGILASVAQYENEVRGERVKAGQAVARKNGKTWGGSKAGHSTKVTPAVRDAITIMHSKGEKIARIARAVGLSRQTVYKILSQERQAR